MNTLLSRCYIRILGSRAIAPKHQIWRVLQTGAFQSKSANTKINQALIFKENLSQHDLCRCAVRNYQTSRPLLDNNESKKSKYTDDDEDKGFALDSGSLVIGVQVIPDTLPRWKVYIRFKEGIGPALTGQLMTLMTPVTAVGSFVASGVSSVVSTTTGWIWSGQGEDKAQHAVGTKSEPASTQASASVENEALNMLTSSDITRTEHTDSSPVDANSNKGIPENTDRSVAASRPNKEIEQKDKESSWGLFSAADWALSLFVKKKGNKKKREDEDEDEHDEDDIHDHNSIKSVYSFWIPIYGTLYYTVSTAKEGKDSKYSYEELSYELDSVKHQATIQKLMSDKILIEEKAALVVYLLVDGLTKVPFAATISKKIAIFILSNLGKNVRSAYNWLADNEAKEDKKIDRTKKD